MNHFFIFLVGLSLIAGCASQPTKKPASVLPSGDQTPFSQDELWQAISELSQEFPIHDLSQEDGTLESDWVYDGTLSRYKFFVSIEKSSSQSEFFVDITSQTRKTESSRWNWVQPSLDKEEKIKNHIHEHIKKNRAA